MILETIHSPADVKRLTGKQTELLCRELRQFLVEQVSRTGGHLASNLGAVELTVAIHRVFDTSADRLVFDVGHQCYVHKALTGRRELFSTLRQFEGLSGFPKPYESVHDAFVAGHASNSVSVALGMARARTLRQQSYSVLALIGDGALGGGLSYEGLNDAGASGEPLIVILNDNGMSIAPNVGGLSRHLSRLRSTPGYYEFKRRYRQMLTGSQTGKRVYAMSHEVKTALKNSLLPGSTVFENMGFTYMGPVDGHDVETLTQMLVLARDMRRPVLLHVHTVKGKGYPFAQKEPGQFHGVAPFDVKTGRALKPSGENFSHVFGQELLSLAREDERICAVTAAMVEGTGLTDFSRTLPRRFFDVGIAEGHAVAMCAGMAQQGMVPVFAVYSSFLQRAYDQLIHDAAISRTHIVLGIDRAGVVGEDGETHQGLFDVPMLTCIPNVTIFSPSDYDELRLCLRMAIYDTPSVAAVRYPRGAEVQGVHMELDRENMFCYEKHGGKVLAVCYGRTGLTAAQAVRENDLEADILKLVRIFPIERAVTDICMEYDRIIVFEESLKNGGIGEHLTSALEEKGYKGDIRINAMSGFVKQAKTESVLKRFRLDKDGITEIIKKIGI